MAVASPPEAKEVPAWPESVPQPTQGGWRWRGLAAWLPLAVTAGIIITLRAMPVLFVSPSYMPLLPWLNFVFMTLISLLIAVLMARSFVRGTSSASLWLGTGMIMLGLGSVLAGAIIHGGRLKAGVEVFTITVCLAGFCQLLGAARAYFPTISRPRGRQTATMALVYGLAVAGVAAVTLISLTDMLPPFWTESGSTPVRSVVLGSAVVAFLLAAALIGGLYRAVKREFLLWYGLGLALLGLGFLAVLAVRAPNSLQAWTARGTQYIGGLYLLRAAVSLMREGRWHMPLERALHEAETRYRLVFESMGEGFGIGRMIYGADGRAVDYQFVEVNAAFERLTGISRSDIVARTALQIIPTLEPQWVDNHARVVETGQPLHWESHNEFTGKTYAIYSCRTTPGRFASIFSDVTERRRAEEALRESEERFRTMADGLPLMVWVNDAEGQQQFVNNTFREFFGVTEEEMLGGGWQALLHPDDADSYVSTFMACVRERRPFAGEGRVRRGDGQWRWIESWGRPRRSATGEFLGYVGTSADITERKATEQAIRESEAKLRLATCNVGMVVFSQDRDLRYTWAWNALEAFADGSYLGKTDEDILPPEGAAILRAIKESVLSSGRSRREEVCYHINCQQVWYDLSVEAVKEADGIISGILCGALDISNRKRAEEALQASENELRRLNQQLEQRVQERTAELAQRAVQLRALARELTLSEQHERRRMARILHDQLQQLLVGASFRLMALGRHSDPAVQQATEEVARLLQESVQVSRSLTAELSPPVLHEAGLKAGLEWLARWMRDKHGLSVELALEEDAPLAEDVKVLIFESVRELLFNTVKHSQTHSARVATRQAEGKLQVTVSDEGRGFDAGAIGRGGEDAGGFGLFSIRERLDLIGGRLEIDSAPGRGSRFALTAPVETASGGSHPPAARAEPGREGRPTRVMAAAGAKIRVLLADDHAVMREGLSRLLGQEADIEVVGHAADGGEAVAQAGRLLPDVILMDMRMPKVSGIEATRAIRNGYPGIRVIGLSMSEEAEGAQALRDAGATDYLTKTAPGADLVAAIRRCMSSAEGERKRRS